MFYLELLAFLEEAWLLFTTRAVGTTAAEAAIATVRNPMVLNKARKLAGYTVVRELTQNSDSKDWGALKIIQFINDADEVFTNSVGSQDLETITEKWMDSIAKQYVAKAAPEWQNAAKLMAVDPNKRSDLFTMLKELYKDQTAHPDIATAWGEKKVAGKPVPFSDPIELLEAVVSSPKYNVWASNFKSLSEQQQVNEYLPYIMAARWDKALASSITHADSTHRNAKGLGFHPLLPIVSPEAVEYNLRAARSPIARTNDSDYLFKKKRNYDDEFDAMTATMKDVQRTLKDFIKQSKP